MQPEPVPGGVSNRGPVPSWGLRDRFGSVAPWNREAGCNAVRSVPFFAPAYRVIERSLLSKHRFRCHRYPVRERERQRCPAEKRCCFCSITEPNRPIRFVSFHRETNLSTSSWVRPEVVDVGSTANGISNERRISHPTRPPIRCPVVVGIDLASVACIGTWMIVLVWGVRVRHLRRYRIK